VSGQLSSTKFVPTDLELVLDHISELSDAMPAWPGGWPGEIEAALIDAVLSIRANYGGPENGVRGAIRRYRGDRTKLNDLARLGRTDPERLAEAVGRQLTGGRPKSEVIVDAAQRLMAAGVRCADDLNPRLHKRAYVSTRGLGPITWSYSCMLLGHPDVKADTWIQRFVEQALGRRTDSTETRRLILAAAVELDLDPRALDHAIWNLMRSRRGR
jgi:hypothetical protein